MTAALGTAFALTCLAVAVVATAEDVCKGHRCDTAACPCGCECGNDNDPGICFVPTDKAATEIPKHMKAVQASGDPCEKPTWSCISEKTVDVPSVRVGQILIKMQGSSVNPVNADMVEPGCIKFPPPLSCSNGTIGGDGSGTVVALGSGCSDFKIGDEVWGVAQGAYAQYALATCDQTGLKPKNLGFVAAGTIPIVGVTSLQCLKAAGMPVHKSNVTVVVTSGQGGTGFMGVQLAKALGATRVITAATGPGIEFAKSMGADVVVDYHEQDLSDVLPNDSVDIVFDNFGMRGTADKMMHAIRRGGTFLVLLGGNGGTTTKNPKKGVRQVNFGMMTPRKIELDELKNLFEADKLHAHAMIPTYSLSKVAQAFTRLRSSGVLGKIAVVPSELQKQSSAFVV